MADVVVVVAWAGAGVGVGAAVAAAVAVVAAVAAEVAGVVAVAGSVADTVGTTAVVSVAATPVLTVAVAVVLWWRDTSITSVRLGMVGLVPRHRGPRSECVRSPAFRCADYGAVLIAQPGVGRAGADLEATAVVPWCEDHGSHRWA